MSLSPIQGVDRTWLMWGIPGVCVKFPLEATELLEFFSGGSGLAVQPESRWFETFVLTLGR